MNLKKEHGFYRIFNFNFFDCYPFEKDKKRLYRKWLPLTILLTEKKFKFKKSRVAAPTF